MPNFTGLPEQIKVDKDKYEQLEAQLRLLRLTSRALKILMRVRKSLRK
jgi:hypothetical protein